MSTIVTRAGKGSPLENSELDLNFTNLNTDKLEINAALGTPASVTLTNATGLPTAGLVDNAVTDAKLRDSAGLSVIGRGANSTGDPADIVAGTNKQVLRRDGSSLGFGAVDLSSNQAVTGTLPVNQGGTGITSFGAGIATWLGTPSSANLAAAVTDETGTGALVFGTNPVIDGATIPARTNPLAQAVSVQMTASTTVGGIQQLDNDNLDMGTNDFTLEFDELLPTTRPAAAIVLDRKHDGTNGYILSLLTTGVVRLQINGFTYDSTVALASATNVNPKLYIPVIRETASAAGSVTFYSNGVILGTAVAIAAHGDLTTELVTNGTFDVDTTGWAALSSATLSVVSNQLQVAPVIGNSFGAATQTITTVAGATYALTAYISSAANTSIQAAAVTIIPQAIRTGTVTANFVASGASTVINLIANNAAGTVALFDNVSVKRVATINNASARIINGTTTTRTAGSLQASRLFNRALDAPTVLDYTINGVALSERGAGQTNIVTNGDFPTDVSGWTITLGASAAVVSGEAQITTTLGGGQGIWQTQAFVAGRRYKVTGDIRLISGLGNAQIRVTNTAFAASAQSAAVTSGTATSVAFEFIASATDNRIYLRGSDPGSVCGFDNIVATQIGLTSELLASNAQSNTGQIIDTSGNRNHALLPASGATVVGRPVSQTREVRWTNTWAGTNELQYIGGVNQAIIPANAYIESIIGTVSGATPHDIIVGDGSDTDRYVTITTGLAAGTTNFALAARTTDGTNLKLTVDPDTNSDMSIAWVISYRILE
jgi:hypothetical protein